ncbi:hypothetical protein SLEP1_g19968 [Rubroshorea leprosula]|uniref:Uncharacterized protein n=1 Tax=Rubroshorea leprosula TaxID=152421 RepID=A0AAV5JBN7_9ROSI|nr:hypothetical protein SLEP1_g19968 [Rubroshorea leprosula]
MAARPSTAQTTYSPSPNQKTRPPLFKDNDLDWVRPDGRSFHQCRPACKPLTFSFYLCFFLSLLEYFLAYFISDFAFQFDRVYMGWVCDFVFLIMLCMLDFFLFQIKLRTLNAFLFRAVPFGE